jgi:ribosome biogenesis GTPase
LSSQEPTDSFDLTDLGWDSDLAESFAPHLGASRFPGRVSRADRSLCTVLTPLPIRASTARQPVTTGDWVVVGDGQTPQDPLQVVAILPRRSTFRRGRSGAETSDQVVAANVDVVFLVTALDREVNQRAIERYLAMGWDSGAVPVLVLTKADCLSETQLAAAVKQVNKVAPGVDVRSVSSSSGVGVEDLAAKWFRPGRTIGLVGASGAGKSTLLNRLAGTDVMETGEVRSDGKGRHTTTHREMVVLPGRAIVIDTPGMRSLGLWLSNDGMALAFPDLEELTIRCRFNDCAHVTEPGCAVLAAIADGTLSPDRLEGWRKLDRELKSLAVRQGDLAALQEQRQHWKALSKQQRQGR